MKVKCCGFEVYAKSSMATQNQKSTSTEEHHKPNLKPNEFPQQYLPKAPQAHGRRLGGEEPPGGHPPDLPPTHVLCVVAILIFFKSACQLFYIQYFTGQPFRQSKPCHKWCRTLRLKIRGQTKVQARWQTDACVMHGLPGCLRDARVHLFGP